MSLACQVAHGVRSPWRTIVPSGSRRMTARSSRELMSSRPSGSQPESRRLAVEVDLDPALAVGRDGEDGVVEEVREPQPAVVPARALAEVQAGEEGLGGQGLARHGVLLRVDGRARSSPQRGAPGAAAAQRGYLGPVAYWVLKAVLTPIFFVLFRVKVEGRENIPKHGPAVLAANHQSFCDSFFIPLVVRAQGDLPGQGRVLRLVEDRLVLPGGRADPDPPRRGQRVGAGARDGAHRGARQGPAPRALPRGHADAWTTTCTRGAPG